MELEGKTVLITPEMAEEFLKHNTRNRNIRLPYVEELATYMRQGSGTSPTRVSASMKMGPFSMGSTACTPSSRLVSL